MLTHYLINQGSLPPMLPDPIETAGDFAKVVLSVKLEEAMTTVSLILAGLFLLFWLTKELSQTLIKGEPIRKMELFKIGGYMGLLVFYTNLINGFADPFFETIAGGIEDLMLDPGDYHKGVLMDALEKGIHEDRGTLTSLDFLPSLKLGLTWILLKIIGLFDGGVEVFFSVYIEISRFIIRIFGPLAIIFSVFPGFGNVFLTWFKLYIKYHFYAIVVSLSVLLSKSFLFFYIDSVLQSSDGTMVTAVNTLAQFPVFVLVGVWVAYIVFKILFIVMGFRMLDNLFGDSGLGVGTMLGGLTTTGSQIALSGVMGSGSVLGKKFSSGSGSAKEGMPK